MENQVEYTIETSNSVKIASDVVATIAALAASDVDGVGGMSGGIVGGIAEKLGRKQLTKGVKVEVGENSCTIDISIVVEYGANIPTVAVEIQENVKKAVENMTGLAVNTINVNVQGVIFPQAEEEQPAAE